MNNNEYVAALNKALIGMDESSRADIIRELESHANESDTLLSGRFGPPDELAKQYLCLLYTSPSPRDATLSRMPSSA